MSSVVGKTLSCLASVLVLLEPGYKASAEGRYAIVSRSTYSLGDFRLGEEFKPSSLEFRDFECAPCQLWPQLARCTREQQNRERRGAFTVTENVLSNDASGIVYANRFFQPAFWSGNEVEEDIDRITKQFNEVPKIQSMPRRKGVPDAVIATWGGITLEPLSPESRATLALGGSPNVGILVDFLGDFTLSVKIGLPVYKIGGTSGAIWIGSYDRKGKGMLRYLIADPSAMQGGRDAQAVPSDSGGRGARTIPRLC